METETFIHLLQAPRNDIFVGRSVQVESTYPAVPDLTYPPAAPNAGLSDTMECRYYCDKT